MPGIILNASDVLSYFIIMIMYLGGRNYACFWEGWGVDKLNNLPKIK